MDYYGKFRIYLFVMRTLVCLAIFLAGKMVGYRQGYDDGYEQCLEVEIEPNEHSIVTTREP